MFFVLWYVSIRIVLVFVVGDGVKRPSPRYFFFFGLGAVSGARLFFRGAVMAGAVCLCGGAVVF